MRQKTRWEASQVDYIAIGAAIPAAQSPIIGSALVLQEYGQEATIRRIVYWMDFDPGVGFTEADWMLGFYVADQNLTTTPNPFLAGWGVMDDERWMHVQVGRISTDPLQNQDIYTPRQTITRPQLVKAQRKIRDFEVLYAVFAVSSAAGVGVDATLRTRILMSGRELVRR